MGKEERGGREETIRRRKRKKEKGRHEEMISRREWKEVREKEGMKSKL